MLEFGGGPTEARGRWLALLMAAFKIYASVGLIPHAEHGGNGVCEFAAAGSKPAGIGLEKLHIVQTQVAVVVGDGSGGWE